MFVAYQRRQDLVEGVLQGFILTLLQNDAQGSAGVDAVQTEITSKLRKNACNNAEKLKVYLFTKLIYRREECQSFHSFQYQVSYYSFSGQCGERCVSLDSGRWFCPVQGQRCRMFKDKCHLTCEPGRISMSNFLSTLF